MCSPPTLEAQFSRSASRSLHEISNFFDVETAQIEAILVMFFGPTVLQFNRFPVYPLHAPQVGPQIASQICVLLLQVASLSDSKSVLKCIRHNFDDILMYPTPF